MTPSGSPGLPAIAAGAVVTVGTFDGVHRGHQRVLQRLAERARELQMPGVVVTFEPHPLEILKPAVAPLRLTVQAEKMMAFASCGVAYAINLPFTSELAAMSAPTFLRHVLVEQFHMRALLIGHDHGFGRGREGDEALVRAIGEQDGFPVELVDAVSLSSGDRVSSTAIRTALESGDLAAAAEALGRPYEAIGRVTRGSGRGRTIGFPTINVTLPSSRKLLPPLGVYAVRVGGATGVFGGMMNLGPRPTFGEMATVLEVHLFSATGDWYGRDVRIEFVERLRDTMKFGSADLLVAQLRQDAERAHRALTALSLPDSLIGSR